MCSNKALDIEFSFIGDKFDNVKDRDLHMALNTKDLFTQVYK